MAQEIKEILGDYLLTAPVSRDEYQLPSPAALRKKIILKHKKLQLESEVSVQLPDDGRCTDRIRHVVGDRISEFEQDILAKECAKRGILYLRDNTKHVSLESELSFSMIHFRNGRSTCSSFSRIASATFWIRWTRTTRMPSWARTTSARTVTTKARYATARA